MTSDGDCVADVEDDLVDGHHLEEEDRVGFLRSQAGLVEKECRSVASRLAVGGHHTGDAVEEDGDLTDKDDLVCKVSRVGRHNRLLHTLLHIDEPPSNQYV